MITMFLFVINNFNLYFYVSFGVFLTCFVALCCCFRCTECHSTLLPGSYKSGNVSGALVCTHHVTRNTSDNQNGRPDLSKRPAAAQSVRIGRSTIPHTSPSGRDQTKTTSPAMNDSNEPPSDVASVPAVTPEKADSLEMTKDVGGETEETPCSSAPPNPFDESDEEETKEEETPAQLTENGDLPPTPISHQEGPGRPVPAPRRVLEATPPPRPAPRVRLLLTADG